MKSPKHKVSAARANENGGKTEGPYELRRIPVGDIKLPAGAKLATKQVVALAQSMKVHGFFGTLLVAQQEGADGHFLLIAGRHRLEAAKISGLQEVPCTVVDTPSDHRRMFAIAENLFRNQRSALDTAEMRCEWLEYAATQIAISRQHVAKIRGRPKAAISYAIETFPHYGGSISAQKKQAERAQKINALPADVKAAAREAKLDWNQRALLQIAKAEGRKAQLRLVAELADANDAIRGEPEADAPRKKGTRSRNSPATSTRAPSTESESVEQVKRTTFNELSTAWKRDCKELWKYAEPDIRGEFLSYLRRSERTCRPDLENLIRRAFLGRGLIAKQTLGAFAEKCGYSGKAVLQLAKTLKYPSRQISDPKCDGPRHAFVNTDRDWKEYVPEVSDAELSEAVDQWLKTKEKRAKSSDLPEDLQDNDYFKMED